ncbi:MAG: hypothetical protein HYZ53_06790 [Planctomycetes bacterium]|nr:hypothetical protein [Planctomycetota bacterium]
MPPSVPHFRIPLDLPHAGTVALRIAYHLSEKTANSIVPPRAVELLELLAPYRRDGENPPSAEAARVVLEAARLGRLIVDDIEAGGLGHDRLGQAVRNLFECLELGEEGATISLRAGENPRSALRAV